MGLNQRRTEMASKKHRPEEAVAKLRQVDVLVSQGQAVAEAIRAVGVTEVTYYRWRREFGGLKSDQVKRLKEREAENTRLRKAVAELTLDKQILAEAARGNFEPRAPARLHRARAADAVGLRAPRLGGARGAPLAAGQGAVGRRRGGGAARGHRRAGPPV